MTVRTGVKPTEREQKALRKLRALAREATDSIEQHIFFRALHLVVNERAQLQETLKNPERYYGIDPVTGEFYYDDGERYC